MTLMYLFIMYLGVMLEFKAAGYLFVAMTLFALFMEALVVMNPQTKIMMLISYIKGNHLPLVLDILQYALFIGITASYGWFMTMGAWVIITGLDLDLRHTAGDLVRTGRITIEEVEE
jgi:hypothetical protein